MRLIAIVLVAFLAACGHHPIKGTATEAPASVKPVSEVNASDQQPMPELPVIEPHEWTPLHPATYEKAVARERIWWKMKRECGR